MTTHSGMWLEDLAWPEAAQRFAETGEAEIGLLFIHGGFGYGKTHLLNAIALEARNSRGARVLFLRAEAGWQYLFQRKGPLMTGAGPMGMFVKTRP